jgi:hypothetical protein
MKEIQSTKEYNNELYLTFISSLTQAMKITNGNEALDLLLNSERVFNDLKRAMEFPESFNVKLILREWNDLIVYEKEFRCFVYQNSLTAISQYDPFFYSKNLIESLETIKDSISLFFEKNVKEKLKELKNYVIDFGMTESGEIFAIELNPFNNENVFFI